MNTKSKLGLGFMRHDLRKNNQEMIDWAMAHDINYFETCYFYLDHQCEDYVYSLLQKYNRESYEICGKLSMSEAFQNDFQFYKTMYREQLNKVPGHYFDVYLLQTLRPQAWTPIYASDLLEFFDIEKQKGNIGRFGFSEQCDAQLLSQFLNYHSWDIAQMPLNYYDWFLCDSQKNYNLIQEHNIPIIAQAPFKGGELIRNKLLTCDNPAQLAMDFVVDKHPEIILTGCSTLSTLRSCYTALHEAQKPNEVEIQNFIQNYRQSKLIPCLLCGKCYCPRGIHIPLHINAFNRALQNPNLFMEPANLRYFSMEPINECNYCNLCVDECPIHLNVPSHFMDIFNLRP